IGAERGGDLGDQRRDIAGLVTHRNDHGHGRRFVLALSALVAHGLTRRCRSLIGRSVIGRCAAARIAKMARASYGARSRAATLLTCANEGPGSARTRPSASITKPSRRAANQSRTSHAPTAPTMAPANTSLG